MSPRYEGIIDCDTIARVATDDRFNIGERDSRSLERTGYCNQSGFHRTHYPTPKNREKFGNLGSRPEISETEPKTALCRRRAAQRANNCVRLHQCCSLSETSPTGLVESH